MSMIPETHTLGDSVTRFRQTETGYELVTENSVDRRYQRITINNGGEGFCHLSFGWSRPFLTWDLTEKELDGLALMITLYKHDKAPIVEQAPQDLTGCEGFDLVEPEGF